MHVAEIWRYPVKSMAGERLDRAELTDEGVAGDRIVQVRSADGRTVDARAHPGLLAHRASFRDGRILVDGRPWDAPDVGRDVEAAAGPGARLAADGGPLRFDVLPLLVASDGAIAAFGRDGRRLRPNLVLGGVEGLAERGWPGLGLRVGEVVIGLLELRSRCVMTTYDPDTQVQDLSVLRRIVGEFGGRLALDAWVVRGGLVEAGQNAELVALGDARPPNHRFGRYADP